MDYQKSTFRQALKANLKQRVTHLALYGGPEIIHHHPVEILPNLYLGDLYTAANALSVRQKGITHILNLSNFKYDAEFYKYEWPQWSNPDNENWVDCDSEIASPLASPPVSPPPFNVIMEYRESITAESPISSFSQHSRTSSKTMYGPPPPMYLTLPIPDSSTFQLSSIFNQTNEFIHSALLSGGTVLVHCHAGKSRSVSIVLAYLVSVRKMLLDDAFNLILSLRPLSKPNQGFAKELVALHESVHGKENIISLRGCEEFESKCVDLPPEKIPLKKEDTSKELKMKISEHVLRHINSESDPEDCKLCKSRNMKQQFLFAKKSKAESQHVERSKTESAFVTGVELEKRLRFQGLV